MVDLFSTYETELNEFESSVNEAIAAVSHSSDKERAREVRQAESIISEAEQTLGQMRLQASAAQRPKVSSYEKMIASWKTALEAATVQSKRASLLGPNTEVIIEMDNMSSESHRERFSNSTQKLAAAGDHIATTRDLIDDMTRTGEGVLGELDRQEEVLKRSQARVDSLDEKMTVANRLMRQISLHLTWGKVALVGVILLMLGGIGLILFLKFYF